MASKKLSAFKAEDCALADFAGALAHPARIAIIKLLQEWGEASCGTIVEALPLSQATVSQHLHCLNKAGLLLQRQCGKRSCYSIDCERVREFCHNFQCTLGTGEEASSPDRGGAASDRTRFYKEQAGGAVPRSTGVSPVLKKEQAGGAVPRSTGVSPVLKKEQAGGTVPRSTGVSPVLKKEQAGGAVPRSTGVSPVLKKEQAGGAVLRSTGISPV